MPSPSWQLKMAAPSGVSLSSLHTFGSHRPLRWNALAQWMYVVCTLVTIADFGRRGNWNRASTSGSVVIHASPLTRTVSLWPGTTKMNAMRLRRDDVLQRVEAVVPTQIGHRDVVLVQHTDEP